jgi:Ni/Co efflux regulator RcnB
MARIIRSRHAGARHENHIPSDRHGSGPCRPCHPSRERHGDGLAKKDPPCIPPGQARRGEGDEHHGRGGGHADRDDLFFRDDYPRYSLPELPYGQRYAVVEDQIVVIDAETYQVLQLIRVFTALAN